MISWSPSLAVGHEEIDEQHRELFRRAELFAEGLQTRSRRDVGILLSYLRFYVVTHFGAEEDWMRAAKYPDYAAHKKQHDQFVRDLLALSDENERRDGPGLEPARVERFLSSWLVEHISRTDLDLASYLAKRQTG
jgi:hemerythrin-like metal-binding protein